MKHAYVMKFNLDPGACNNAVAYSCVCGHTSKWFPSVERADYAADYHVHQGNSYEDFHRERRDGRG